MKKLLIYNWTHIDDKQGGGVNLYVRNLIGKLLEDKSYEIFYLNSGLTYTRNGIPKIISVTTSFGNSIKAYEIINSPFVAPARQNGKNIEMYLYDKTISVLFDEFVKVNAIKIIHFNNIEGLPIEVPKIKQRIPHLKVIYSAHNYFALCSRVNLWQNGEGSRGHNCSKQSYKDCNRCYRQSIYRATILSRKFPSLKHLDRVSRWLNVRSNPKLFRDFHEYTIEAINNNVDAVLAVSNRVAKLLIEGGLNKSIVKTSYIGTIVAEKQRFDCRTNHSSILRILYMGYMQREKGFYFFLECLEKMDLSLANNIDVKIVARYKEKKNAAEVKRIKGLQYKFHAVKLINGYTPDNQEKLLDDIDMGVIPVLWEDNLPQVAIEQLAYGIPILTSNLGGAHELHNSDNFTYIAGNHNDLLRKIEEIYHHKEYLDEFWKHVVKLKNMNEHIEELKKYYEY